MSFDDFLALCQSRRSTRHFQEKAVTKEIIFHLIGAAMLAPNVLNMQPWHFHIVENGALKRKLMETSCYGNFIEGSGIFIVVSCNSSATPEDKSIVWNPRELEYSCVAAMEHLLLGATAMNLGSCFVSLHHGTAHEILKLPHEQSVIGGVMIGYPLKEAVDEKEHKRKDLKEMFTIY